MMQGSVEGTSMGSQETIGVQEQGSLGAPQAPTGIEHLKKDLALSGLTPEDMGAYLAESPEIAAVGLRPHHVVGGVGGSPGYIIPYYTPAGLRAPFYRMRLFKPLPKGAKYLQPADTPAYIYYPKGFTKILSEIKTKQSMSCINGFDPVLMIVEGEKKAAKAVRDGFLCVGLGGVYNWRTRVLHLPESAKIAKNADTGAITVRLPDEEDVKISLMGHTGVLAEGMEELIFIARTMRLQVVISFDTDIEFKPQVQQAAAALAFELRSHGISSTHIRQLKLPSKPGQKVAIDDFLVEYGPTRLQTALHDVLAERCAFPRHPQIKKYVNSVLQIPQLKRAKARELALSILADLDARGLRMREVSTDMPYYFNIETKKLMPVNLLHHHQEPLHETHFGQFLYQEYDISQADAKLIPWIAAGFTGEAPVQDVMPRSTLALLKGDRLAVQLNDGQFAIVSGDPREPLKVKDNGTEGVLFRGDQVEPCDILKLTKAFQEQLGWLTSGDFKFEDLWWYKALSQFKFVRPTDVTLLTLLFYISPWLWRWRGAQLPVELMIGEPGSGKSSMQALRLGILNGRPVLRNQPTDIRDWYSSITAGDGLHVVDNVHFATKEIRQRLSDEICRLVTEPNPFVEMRRLFSTADNMRIPVRTVFALTAIQQPFVNADILQRSCIFELGAVGKNHSSDWPGDQLRVNGGREKWLAHHLVILHLFFRAVGEGKWDPQYQSGHRLANFEQCLSLMGGILKCEEASEISRHMATTAEEQVSEYDWTMDGLKEYCQMMLPDLQRNPKLYFSLQDVAAWAMSNEDYAENQLLINARKLARYIKSHAYMVTTVTGLYEHGKIANRMTYRVNPPKKVR